MSFLSTLYVGNVAYSSDEADLTQLFSQYGNVLSTEIKRGFAFVKFETVQSAQTAAQALDNQLFNGRNLKVNFSKSEPHPSNRQTPFQQTPNNNNINSNQNGRPQQQQQQQRVSCKDNSLHVANLPHTITEENLREVFDAYGILNIHIIRTRKICFAIIELSSEENMTNAITQQKDLVIDGREIAVTQQVVVPERHNNNFGRGGRGRSFRGANYRNRGFSRGGNFQRNDQTFRIDNNLHNNVNNGNNQNNSPIDEQQKQRGDFYDNNKYRGSNYRYRGDMFGGRGQYGSRGGQYRPRGRGGYRGRGRNNNFFNNNNNNANPSSEE